MHLEIGKECTATRWSSSCACTVTVIHLAVMKTFFEGDRNPRAYSKCPFQEVQSPALVMLGYLMVFWQAGYRLKRFWRLSFKWTFSWSHRTLCFHHITSEIESVLSEKMLLNSSEPNTFLLWGELTPLKNRKFASKLSRVFEKEYGLKSPDSRDENIL